LETLAWIILFCTLSGVLSIVASAGILVLPDRLRGSVLPHLVSFAIGALLGAAFLALLPHALGSPQVTDLHDITLVVLIGILIFFVLEKLVLWRHCHHSECEVHTPEEGHDHAHNHHHHHQDKTGYAGTLVLFGDGVHNFVDGVLIAAAFLVDTELGIVTALAVATHEIPQEIGDFAVLLSSGFSRKKALMYNLLSSLAMVVGGVAAYFVLQEVEHLLPYVLAVAAASFIYVAVADLIPSLHKKTELKVSLQQTALIVLGVVVIYTSHQWMHGG